MFITPVPLLPGWGTTFSGGATSTVARDVSLTIYGTNRCRSSYADSRITDRMICAGVPQGGKDSCQVSYLEAAQQTLSLNC